MRAVVVIALLALLAHTGVAEVGNSDFQFSFNDYHSQLEEWEQGVKELAQDSSSLVDLDESLYDDDEEEDIDLIEEVDEDDKAPITVNLDESDTLSEEEEEASVFESTASVASHFATEDYLDGKVEVDLGTYESSNSQSKPTYCMVSNDEVKDAMVLARKVYRAKVTVKSPLGVQAEIYLRHTMTPQDSGAQVVSNLDIGESVKDDWALVQGKFKKFGKVIKDSAIRKWKKVQAWASKVKHAVQAKLSNLKQWGSSLKQDAYGKYLQIRKSAKAMSKSLGSALNCKIEPTKYARTMADVGVCTPSPLEKTAFVVFRGTDRLTDWIQNLKFKQSACNFPGCVGKVHSGFKRAYDAVRNQLFVQLNNLINAHKIQRVVVAGHSLGGALALLHAADASYNLAPVQLSLVTFGQPRVGDKQFAAYANEQLPAFPRVFTQFQKASCGCKAKPVSDFVTTVPRSWLDFAHAGQATAVPCGRGDCTTRCCPQKMINSIKCHSSTMYLQGVYDVFH